MPLSALQLEVMKSPKTRTRFGNNAAQFAYVDKLLHDSGASCPRLPHVWNAIFDDSTKRAWVIANFPGAIVDTDTGKPLENPKMPKMVGKKPSSPVNRAIKMLQSYRAKP